MLGVGGLLKIYDSCLMFFAPSENDNERPVRMVTKREATAALLLYTHEVFRTCHVLEQIRFQNHFEVEKYCPNVTAVG